jgi:hypothetical protein
VVEDTWQWGHWKEMTWLHSNKKEWGGVYMQVFA